MKSSSWRISLKLLGGALVFTTSVSCNQKTNAQGSISAGSTNGSNSTSGPSAPVPVPVASANPSPVPPAGPSPVNTAPPPPSNPSPVAGAPAAPKNFEMTNQEPNAASFSWTAAVPSSYPIDHYNIYRATVNSTGNVGAYSVVGTSTGTKYRDATAKNITTPGGYPNPYIPATEYKYAISAVDSQRSESTIQYQISAWVYHNGVDNWTTTTNSYGGGFTINSETANGISVTLAPGGYWMPFSGNPFLTNMGMFPYHSMELGAFNYVTIDLMPAFTGETWTFAIISRVTIGDNYNSATVTLGGSDATFGPPSQAGKWATYKIPFKNPNANDFSLFKSLQIGFGQYSGYISGNSTLLTSVGTITTSTLTVTGNVSGINVQGSSYLSGGNIVQGTASTTGTYVLSSNGTSGGPGTYTVSPAQSVGPISITAQRTNMYKVMISDLSGQGGTIMVNNFGFTAQ